MKKYSFAEKVDSFYGFLVKAVVGVVVLIALLMYVV